jgi:hypothetical protein
MEQGTTQLKLKDDIAKSLDLIRTLRDEVRLQLHLAGMEAKERWGSLEPRLEAVEKAAQEATESSRQAVQEAVGLLKEFRASLSRKG